VKWRCEIAPGAPAETGAGRVVIAACRGQNSGRSQQQSLGVVVQEQVYPYKQKRWFAPLVIVFFAAAAYVLYQAGESGQSGLLIGRFIELSPQEATYFHWALFAASLLFVLIGCYVLLLSLRKPRQVRLAPEVLVAPKGAASRRYVHIPYENIETLHVQQVHGQRFLHIHHLGGKLLLVQSLLPSKEAFDELCRSLAERVRGSA
jgi:hypothetical protein